MKKVLLIICLFVFAPQFLFAATQTDADLLKQKLAKFKQINADFSQVVSNVEGDVLNKSSGHLTILRPGKFRWQVSSPDEQLMISDSKTMWLYNPFIEQVTLMNLSDAIEGTPFVLLSGGAEQQWGKYIVTRHERQFTIKSSDPKVNHNTFIFEFNKADNISRFVVIEAQGQRSEFTLTYKAQLKNIPAGYFSFKVPEGVEIDDQR